jgi:hypothetical protein
MFSLAPRPDFVADDERDLIDMKEDLEALLLEGTINARPNRVGPVRSPIIRPTITRSAFRFKVFVGRWLMIESQTNIDFCCQATM